jgi:hypothetical protein
VTKNCNGFVVHPKHFYFSFSRGILDFQTLLRAIFLDWNDLIYWETNDISCTTRAWCAGCKKSYATNLLTNDLLDTASFQQQLASACTKRLWDHKTKATELRMLRTPTILFDTWAITHARLAKRGLSNNVSVHTRTVRHGCTCDPSTSNRINICVASNASYRP